MTDEDNITKSTNKDNEQETIESDIEQEESACSSATTDDEFYNELMAAPAEFEDHLILDGCKDDIIGIEHLTSCLNRRYNSCPVVFTGTLKDSIKEAFNSKDIKERRPLLIYINNDKSLYSNLFCKQLLCYDKIIDFLLNNYVLWAWDVTFQSNGEKLTEMFKAAFAQWNTDQQIGTKSIEQYPVLIGVSRDINGDYLFTYLIHGSDKRPDVDEFLARLIQFKDQFDDNEADFERQSKHNPMNNLFRKHDFPHQSKYHNDYDFSQSTLMNFDRNSPQYSGFLSANNHEFSLNNRIILSNTFRQLNINPNDGDDEDDDDDQTPTVDHPSLKFPK